MNLESLLRNYWPFMGLLLVGLYYLAQRMAPRRKSSQNQFSIGDEIELSNHGKARISDIHIYEIDAQKYYAEYEIIMGAKSFVSIDDGGVYLTTREIDFKELALQEDDIEKLYQGQLKKLIFENIEYVLEESYEGFFYESSNFSSSDEFFCCEYLNKDSLVMSICMFDNDSVEVSFEQKL